MIGRVPVSIVSLLAWIAMSSALTAGQPAAAPADSTAAAFTGPFRWTATPPLVSPAPADGESWHSMKDPSIVQAGGRWHLGLLEHSR